MFISFASAFLLKVFRPCPNEFVEAAVTNFIQVLSLPGLVAVDERQSLNLYTSFPAKLLGLWKIQKSPTPIAIVPIKCSPESRVD